MTGKARARGAAAAWEAGLSPEWIEEAGPRLTAAILALPEFQAARRVLFYIPVGREPDVGPALRAALEMGKTCAVPRILGPGAMEARGIAAWEERVPGAYGIPTAPAGAPLLDPGELDLILVPGAAFDAQGVRLGRGGGFYDRYLPRSGGVRAGVAFRLWPEALPREAHDAPVDLVVTPAGAFRVDG